LIAGLLAFIPALNGKSHGVAAIVISIVIALVPSFPLLAMRLGKMPVPALPDKPEDLVKDEPLPDRDAVYAAVVRSDEMLSGLLIGAAVTTVACELALILSGTIDGPILA